MRLKILILGALAIGLSSFLFHKNLSIVDKKMSVGYKKPDSTRTIDAIIIHSTYNAAGTDSFSLEGCIKQFRNYGVSAHYIISRDGNIYRLVDEANISYHAGKSSLPDGRTNVNSTSIGIEIITTKKSSPTEAQYNSVASLVKDIKTRYTIKYIQGHHQIAPGRKTDPWNFDWTKFNALTQ